MILLRHSQEEWRHLIAGSTITPLELENPASEWLSERVWKEVLTLPVLPKFSTFAQEFSEHSEVFKKLFDSQEPHK